MKKIFLFIILSVVWFWFNFSQTNLYASNTNTYSNSIFRWSATEIPYCKWNQCWIEQWVRSIKNIDWIENEASASEYIQRVTKYVLWFLALIATLFIIYSWFVLLTSAWDEEKAKKSKTIIMYSIIWIIIIFLAWPIVDFVLNILK